jgi:hypothetical protein
MLLIWDKPLKDIVKEILMDIKAEPKDPKYFLVS